MSKDIVEILPNVGNMRQTAQVVRDAEQANYAHYMAKMLSISEAQREENRKLEEIRAKRRGMTVEEARKIQCASTQAIIDRPKEKDLEHWLRPLPDCQIKDKDGNIDVGERPVTIEEVSHIESIRRRPKNSTGQSTKSGAGNEAKEAARNAYLCSPGIPLDQLTHEQQAEIVKPKPYSEPPTIAVESLAAEPKETGWFKGGSTWWSNLLYRWRSRK